MSMTPSTTERVLCRRTQMSGFEDGLMGKNTLTHQRPTKRGRRVFTESVKDIELLNERRIGLTELEIRLQSHDQSPWPAPCTSSTRCWRKGDEA